MAGALYDKDFYAWTQEQAHYIKTKAFDKLDIEHLFDEVESMGASERKELTSRLKTLLVHLLKWKYQPNRQCKSWTLTIREQRKELHSHLKNNPSLKNSQTLKEKLSDAYETAILRASNETNLDEDTFPQNCEWTIEQVLDNEFYPS